MSNLHAECGEDRDHWGLINPDTPQQGLVKTTSAADPFTMTWIKGAGTIVVTLFIFIIVGAWLYFTATKVGIPPQFNSKGIPTIDQYGRAKDILLIVFPLATAAVGFWFGNQQTAQAQKQADTATQSAQLAHAQARQSQAKVEAILGASDDTQLMEKAKAAAPAAFADLETPPVAPEGPAGNAPLVAS